MSKRRLRIAATAIALASTFALSACGSNFSAQTNHQYQAAVGSNVRSGPIQVFNALFVDNGDGTATFSGALLAPSGSQEIVEAAVPGADVSLSGPIKLAKNTLFTVGAQGEIITTLDPNQIGRNIELTLTSTSGDKLAVSAVVVERSDMYASVAKSAPKAATPVAGDDAEADTE
ncbi:MAG: hypothetical protein GX678_04635 [Actinomycetales bacterium]|nr:hypothetical protein [Actinomycetales bacterium]